MIRLALRHPVSTSVAAIALAALGLLALVQLPVSLLPSIERPELTVTARAAGRSQEEMLHSVTERLERRLRAIDGVQSMESETSDGRTRIILSAAWQTDADRLRIDVARRVDGASEIPLDELTVEVAGGDPRPLVEVAVLGGTGGARALTATRVVIPELSQIEGAGRLEVVGASPIRLCVTPRASDLAARGLTALDVQQRLADVGRPLSAGRVRDGAAIRPVIIVQPVRSLEELAALPVETAAGPVALRDVADVTLREVPDSSSFRHFDPGSGRSSEGTLVQLYRAPGANAVAVARAARKKVAELNLQQHGIHLLVTSDRSTAVVQAVVDLGVAAILGLVLGTIVLRFMLGHWRPTLALCAVIPISLLVAFAVFRVFGIALDLISLAGLALATGLLVDNSIVVLEAIESARLAGSADPVLSGTRQIAIAVVASSVTLMIVFAPLLYMRGLARAFFGEQAIAVVASVGASLLFSLTLTPMLAARTRSSAQPRSPGRATYLRLLERSLARPLIPLLTALVFTIAAGGVLAVMRRELFSRGAERAVRLEFFMPRDTDPAVVRAAASQIWSSVIGSVDRDDLEAIDMTSGVIENDSRLATAATGRIEIFAKSSSAARHALQKLRATISSRPGVSIQLATVGSDLAEGALGQADRVEMIVSAPSERGVETLATRVIDASKRNGLMFDATSGDRPLPVVAVRWNEPLLAANRAERSTLEQQVRAATGRIDLGRTEIIGAEEAIRLQPTTPENLALAPMRLPGEPVRIIPLGAIASTAPILHSATTYRDQGRPARRLSWLSKGAAATASSTIAAEVRPAEGERLRFAGQQRELRESFSQIRLAFALALVLLYLTVAAFYESLILPLLVIAAVPIGIAGAIISLAVTGQSLNVMSLISLVLLGGIVVNHTVVLIDRIEQLRRQGRPEHGAIREAARERYRPIIMTTATAILGMLPLALAGGSGVELRRAVAIAVMGGLITATGASLVVVPLLHRMVEPWRRRRAAAVVQSGAPMDVLQSLETADV